MTAAVATSRPSAGRSRNGTRVAFFVHMLPRFVDDFGAWATALSESGAEVRIHAPPPRSAATTWWKQPAVLNQARERLPRAVELLPLEFERDRWSLPSLWKMMRAVHREAVSRPDTVFVFWTTPIHLFCGVHARLRRRRTVFLVTGMGSGFGSNAPRWKQRVLGGVYRRLLDGGDVRVIVHNHEDQAWIARTWGKPIEHIRVTPGCGVDPDEFPRTPLPDDVGVPVVYAPIRLIEEKGVRDLVAASALLRDRGVVHELWFTGDVDTGNPSGLQSGELETIGRRHPQIRFQGYQSDIRPIYRRCRAVCIPTKYREGLPTAILEAASMGRPLVVTDNIGCREFVVDEATGLMVPPGDPESLAAGIRRLLEDRALSNRLVEEAHRRFLRGFTKRVMVERSLEVVDDLASPRRGGDI
jgi:glycosyltransferase involved in cell wall biosynthesis